MTLILGTLADPPPPPKGESAPQLYQWAKGVITWASSNNLVSSPVLMQSNVLKTPKPWPSVSFSVLRSSYQKYHVAISLTKSAAGSVLAVNGLAYLGLPRSDSFNWYANAVNKSVSFSTMQNLSTLKSGAVYVVWLSSTGNNIVTVRHSGTATRAVALGFFGGHVAFSDLMQFSTVA